MLADSWPADSGPTPAQTDQRLSRRSASGPALVQQSLVGDVSGGTHTASRRPSVLVLYTLTFSTDRNGHRSHLFRTRL